MQTPLGGSKNNPAKILLTLVLHVEAVKELKHDGLHCIEARLDGQHPQRTPWVLDETVPGTKVKPFGTNIVFELPRGWRPRAQFLHVAAVHQRQLRMDKRVGEAHFALDTVPFDSLNQKFSATIMLEHKNQFAGSVRIKISLQGGQGRGGGGGGPGSGPPWVMPGGRED